MYTVRKSSIHCFLPPPDAEDTENQSVKIIFLGLFCNRKPRLLFLRSIVQKENGLIEILYKEVMWAGTLNWYLISYIVLQNENNWAFVYAIYLALAHAAPINTFLVRHVLVSLFTFIFCVPFLIICIIACIVCFFKQLRSNAIGANFTTRKKVYYCTT